MWFGCINIRRYFVIDDLKLERDSCETRVHPFMTDNAGSQRHLRCLSHVAWFALSTRRCCRGWRTGGRSFTSRTTARRRRWTGSGRRRKSTPPSPQVGLWEFFYFLSFYFLFVPFSFEWTSNLFPLLFRPGGGVEGPRVHVALSRTRVTLLVSCHVTLAISSWRGGGKHSVSIQRMQPSSQRDLT